MHAVITRVSIQDREAAAEVLREQVVPQVMPEGEEVTVPLPFFVTVRVNCEAAACTLCVTVLEVAAL